jgi:hypothetical protein
MRQRQPDARDPVLPHGQVQRRQARGDRAQPPHVRVPRLEFFGPYEQFEGVRDTLLEAGAGYGLRQIGARLRAGADRVRLWAEPDGGSSNPQVERHSQTAIRATVSRGPFPQG